MKLTESIRVPVSVRLGRLRWEFRMPPVYMRAVGWNLTQAHPTVELRGGLRFRAALLALKAATFLLLVPVAWLLRTSLEVRVVEDAA